MNNQMSNTVRKIHNLLSSGAVTVTGPNQPRILKQKIVSSSGSGNGSGTAIAAGSTTGNSLQQIVSSTGNRCYVCDDVLGANQAQNQLTEMQTSHSATKFPNKIGQLVGDAFMVIVSVEDVVCARCTNLINYLDRLENDVERVRTNLINLLHKKYGLNDDNTTTSTIVSTVNPPPNKLQKLNSGVAVGTTQQKISTTSPSLTGAITHQQSAGTQTLQRKTTKIYKCLSCEYKTSDMRLFNTHYETCKPQNFQCKNCKKIFHNFGSMKLHMVREHNTPMDNTCAVCHINFASEAALRKHMEANHSTSVVVTSTTTVPLNQVALPQPATDDANVNTTNNTRIAALYTCNHCQFRSTDKVMFDEHMRKHVASIKSKPFKCRICAQRFETRDAATTHAKQHQGNVFRCGTCSMSFNKRELLVKHFEIHQQTAQQQSPPQIHQQTLVTQQQQQQHQVVTVKQQNSQQSSQNLFTTQKLLQDTIDEALSEASTTTPMVTTTVSSDISSSSSANTSANNIRFFSCHLCSLTFIQENYYNQHMETHQRGETNMKKNSNNSNNNSNNAMTTIANAAALLSETSSQLDLNEIHCNNKLDDLQQQQLEQQQPHQHQQLQSNLNNTNNTISEADIESIFEKMHSDKGEALSTATTTTTNRNNEHVVITSQAGQGGDITFNITIPGGQESDHGSTTTASTSNRVNRQQDQQKHTPIATTTAPVSVSIDMPMLDQPGDGTTTATSSSTAMLNNTQSTKSTTMNSGPVSMPSLDDDNEDPDSPTSASQSQTTTSIEMNEDIKDVMKKEEINVNMDEQHSLINTREPHQDTIESSSGHAVKIEANAIDSSEGGERGNLMTPSGEQHSTNSANEEATMSVSAPAHEDGPEEENLSAQEHMVATGEQHQVSMELDEATMQAQVDSGQIKFILNENGQLLQLDNHIITDAEGNQILVQDPEQIQQLLQSVGVLQTGDGLDGETLQMVTDANGQMVLVHGENNETQLIDASLLNAEGQLVIQQSQDGDGAAHVIGEDGTRIPVSVSYTEDGQPIVQVQQQVLEAAGVPESILEKENAEGNHHNDVVGVSSGGLTTIDDTTVQHNVTTTSGGVGSTSGSSFFALDELMQQSPPLTTTTSTTAAVLSVTPAKTD